MQTLTDIRRTFIDFFKKNHHQEVLSSPLIPHNDPSLLFTNAGMVQFKDVFTGKEKRPYQRAVTAQKCLRAGGKHNDLENVGYTARHHTFFEMLGNFSFGDYFKDQAINYAWTLVTKEFSLDPKRLLVTVYADDEEAATLWRKIAHLEDNRIIRISTNDNFWSMGDTGPCGPCSEIFYDHGESVAGGPPGSAHQDGDRFIEIWNLVFMQFEQHADGRRTPLPNPSIDTGMGLERMAAVIQGVHSNYDIDLFQTLITASQHLSSVDSFQYGQSHHVIADHIRSCSFLIADGVMPSNEGRGYVLRRIMRRAMRHAHKLGAKEPLLYRLVPPLISLMGESYPELVRARSLIEQVLKQEEEKFHQTLDKGLKLLRESTASLNKEGSLSGDIAFKLYDTYGFPLDLTQDILRSDNKTVDEKGFQDCMEVQKQKARKAWQGSGEAANEDIWFKVYDQFGATEFLGYNTPEAEAKILALAINNNFVHDVDKPETELLILTNQTPFYAESGGQLGDQGTLTTDDGVLITITDTLKKIGKLHIHKGLLEKGQVQVGQTVKMVIDQERRRHLAANHSATHLLHAVLREILGSHVTQKGSFVAPDKLRFDFTHPKALTDDEIKTIEKKVNLYILTNQITQTQIMSPAQAIEQGALVLFGERYGEEVRVVSMGKKNISVELCGGTHVQALGDIGLFKIVSESSVSSGVRRIEAITGLAILNLLDFIQQSALKDKEQGRQQVIDLQKQLTQVRKQLALRPMKGQDNAKKATQTLGPYPALIHHLQNVPARELKALVDHYKKELKSGIIVLTSEDEDKLSLVIGVTSDLTTHVNAITLVQAGARSLNSQGRGGGGRPDLAQAGGPKPQNMDQLMKALHDFLGPQSLD